MLARLALAVVFTVSAIAKLRDRGSAREAVLAFGVPPALVPAVAAGLPFVELTCAALLVAADPGASAGAVASLLLLAAFTAAVVNNLVRGRRPDCHCFGSLSGTSGIGWATVGRNAGLLALAAASLVGAGTQGFVPTELADYSAVELVTGFGVLLTVGALVALSLAVRTLVARYGAVLLRLEALEFATGTAEPAVAPVFALPTLDGPGVILDDVLAEQHPVLLVFVSTSCVMCADLLPELAHWQTAPGYPLRVLVASDDTPDANRNKIAEVAPTLQVLLLAGRGVSQAYGVDGTPAAVLIGVDGRLASAMTYGVQEIRTLVAGTVHAMGAAARARHEHPAPEENGTGAKVHEIGPRPVAAGDPLPTVEVETESGALVQLVDALPAEAVLLFWRTNCGYCARILDEVREVESSLSMVLVTSSSTEEIRGSGLRSPILRDPGRDLNAALQVPGTPAAVAIRQLEMASAVAVGGPGVLELLRSGRHAASLIG